MKKTILFFPLVIVIFCIYCNANDINNSVTSEISLELNELKNSLPDEVLDYLPNEIWNGDFSSLLNESLNESNVMNSVIDYMFLGLNSAIKGFSSILSVLLISSIFNMLQASLSKDLIKSSFSLCSALCTSFTVFYICTSLTNLVSDHLHGLCSAMESFAPIMTSIYIMSGSLGSATVSNASILIFIAIIERFLLAFMLPIIKACICFSVLRSFGGQIEFGGFSKVLKNTFTGVTVFIMSIFMFTLSTKRVLAQSADSLSIKTAKFAISNFIPVVGSSVNDAMSTLSASISYIKSSCGILGIIIIALITLPIIISLLLNRLCLSIAAGIAKALNSNNESAVIEEGYSICGFLLAIVCCTCILFIFALTIFIKSSVLGA